jgi:hypothetical protein
MLREHVEQRDEIASFKRSRYSKELIRRMAELGQEQARERARRDGQSNTVTGRNLGSAPNGQ